MKKEEIDKYFTEHYNRIALAVSKIKSNNRPRASWDVTDLVSNTYEHILLNKDKVRPNTIEGFVIRYVNNQVRWTKSKINSIDNHPKMVFVESVFDFNDESSEDDLKDKIDRQVLYQYQMGILFDFYNQLPTKEEKILYEVIYIKGIKTVDSISKHLGVNKSYVREDRKNLRLKLEEYVKLNY
jgi:hypothetical protein